MDVHGKHAGLIMDIVVGLPLSSAVWDSEPRLIPASLSCAPLPSITMSTAQTHFDKAIQEIQHRNPANRPTVDFSIQHLDDGAIISTRERFIKDVRRPFLSLRHRSATCCVVH